MRRGPGRRRTGLGVCVLLLALGCAPADDTTADSAGADSAGADDAGAGGSVATAHGDARQVVLTEMAVGTSTPWPAGEQLLHVRNDGGAHHNLIVCPGDHDGCAAGGVAMDVLDKPEVRDPSVIPDRTSSLVLGSGADAVVRTDPLEPGSYLLWCAIPNHAARGMQLVVAVE